MQNHLFQLDSQIFIPYTIQHIIENVIINGYFLFSELCQQPTANSQQPTANSQQPTVAFSCPISASSPSIVSVIIPVYNVENYLRECLYSVVSQTYKYLEILCINDCSTDNSLEFAQEFARKDNRIKIINHTINRGLGAARNTGIDNASGDFILFLDSDDWLQQNCIELMVLDAQETNADIVMSQSQAFPDVDEDLITRRIKGMNSWLSYSPVQITRIPLSEILECKIPCVAWGKLFSKKFLVQHNLSFVENHVKHEDNGFWLKCVITQPAFSCIPDIGTMYRIRKNSITGEQSFQIDENHVLLSYEDAITYLKKEFSINRITEITPHLLKMLNRYSRGLTLFAKHFDVAHIVKQFSPWKHFVYHLLSKLTLGKTQKKFKKKYQKQHKLLETIKEHSNDR